MRPKTRSAPRISVAQIADWRRPDWVALRSPRDAFLDAKRIDKQWQALHFRAPPDLEKSIQEFEAFAGILRRRGVKSVSLGRAPGLSLDSIYAKDALAIVPRGIVQCRMGKSNRSREPAANRQALERQGVKVAFEIVAPGTLEGGDIVWLDDSLVAVGLSYRTNASGAEQYRSLVGADAECVFVQIPGVEGPDCIWHLSSMISVIGEKICVVDERYLSIHFLTELKRRGFRLISIDKTECGLLACNVFSLGDDVVCMIAGSPITAWNIRRAGFMVETFAADNLCLAGDGGPTCLVRTMRRV
ncbi:MAG TPA: arginine deiminase family protein [Rhizomicrobium sp.]